MLLQFIDFCEHLFMHSSSEELTFEIILLSNILVYRGVNAAAAKQTPHCPISGLSLSPPGLCSLLTKCKHVCRCCVNIALHFDIMTLQELMPGYLLWILVALWTSSSWLCSWIRQLPSAAGWVTFCLTGSNVQVWAGISQTLHQHLFSSRLLFFLYTKSCTSVCQSPEVWRRHWVIAQLALINTWTEAEVKCIKRLFSVRLWQTETLLNTKHQVFTLQSITEKTGALKTHSYPIICAKSSKWWTRPLRV